jgi:hypothetical protein
MKISVLCPARPNSALLAHLVVRFLSTVKNHEDVNLIVMMNVADKWNKNIKRAFPQRNVLFVEEDFKLGRQGLHVYYNELAKLTNAEWLMMVCEDHDWVMDEWDQFMLDHLKSVDCMKPNIFYPRFTNIGAVCPVLSRGYVNAVGGNLSAHYSFDSWINEVAEACNLNVADSPDEKMMVDHTHGGPPWNVAAPMNGKTWGFCDPDMVAIRHSHIDMIRKARGG